MPTFENTVNIKSVHRRKNKGKGFFCIWLGSLLLEKWVKTHTSADILLPQY
jgi:hypothetical protein